MSKKAEDRGVTPPRTEPPRLSHEVGVREERMLKARKQKARSVWMGFGSFGLIGWSIVVPTLIGIAIGRWLDQSHPGERSWTLVFFVAGLSLGCLNASRWIRKEQREIETEEAKEDDHE